MINTTSSLTANKNIAQRLQSWYRTRGTGISRNVKILVATEPLWAIPVTWVKTYAPLYMSALGLTATQIGWIASLTLITQMLVAPLGGFVADRFGRKRVLITFDTIAWIMPMVIWMLAQNAWYFVAAAILNGIGMIIGPSWNCLLVEDTEPRRRSAVLAAFQVVVLGAGLFSPLAGWIIDDFSIERGTRILYFIAAASIGSMVLTRALTIRETSVGEAMVSEFRHRRVKDALQGYREVFSHGIRNRTLVLLLFLSTINFAYITLWQTYSALYMTHAQGLRLKPAVVSMWPTFSSVIMIITLLVLVPRVRLERLPQWLVFSSGLLLAGMVVFLLAPAGSYPVLAAAAILIAVGTALINPVRDTFIANVMDDRARAALLAAMNSFSMLVVAPLTPLAGRLFEINPRFPLVMLFALLTTGLIISWNLRQDAAPAKEETGAG